MAKGNLRDGATELELQVLANMESMNAGLIQMGFSQQERMDILIQRAERELEVLAGQRASEAIKRIGDSTGKSRK